MDIDDIEIKKSYKINGEDGVRFEALEVLPPESEFNFTKEVLVWGERYIIGSRKVFEKRWFAPSQLENI